MTSLAVIRDSFTCEKPLPPLFPVSSHPVISSENATGIAALLFCHCQKV
jgi:hypothetical protein